jgi:hypothetical protein
VSHEECSLCCSGLIGSSSLAGSVRADVGAFFFRFEIPSRDSKPLMDPRAPGLRGPTIVSNPPEGVSRGSSHLSYENRRSSRK